MKVRIAGSTEILNKHGYNGVCKKFMSSVTEMHGSVGVIAECRYRSYYGLRGPNTCEMVGHRLIATAWISMHFKGDKFNMQVTSGSELTSMASQHLLYPLLANSSSPCRIVRVNSFGDASIRSWCPNIRGDISAASNFSETCNGYTLCKVEHRNDESKTVSNGTFGATPVGTHGSPIPEEYVKRWMLASVCGSFDSTSIESHRFSAIDNLASSRIGSPFTCKLCANRSIIELLSLALPVTSLTFLILRFLLFRLHDWRYGNSDLTKSRRKIQQMMLSKAVIKTDDTKFVHSSSTRSQLHNKLKINSRASSASPISLANASRQTSSAGHIYKAEPSIQI
eukprot:jgi/Bigna1/133408/aug1.21_g8116